MGWRPRAGGGCTLLPRALAFVGRASLTRCCPAWPNPAEEAKEAEEEAPAAAEYDATFGAAQALPGTEAAFDEYG